MTATTTRLEPGPPAQRSGHGGPLGELRALKRAGFAAPGDLARARRLAASVSDPLDAEAVGALLGGDRTRAALEAAGARPVSVALLGSSTLDALGHLLRTALVGEGIAPRVVSAGFNQWRFALAGPDPELLAAAPRVVALLLDDQAVFDEVADPVDLDEIAARCAAFPDILASWAGRVHSALGALSVLCTVPLSPRRRDVLVDFASRARLSALWHEMNARICALAERHAGVVVLDAVAVGMAAGGVEATDRMRHIASHAYGTPFLWAYAGELGRVVRASLGLARKCLVLDLDDTLWGGVAADDGLGGIKVAGSYPGGAFRELQTAAKALSAQGVVLAVASKNDEAVVREVFADQPEMVLRADAFAAVRANWAPKPDNVRALAAELNLGLDALVFVDDNPVERGLMRELAPEVSTVELPVDPAERTAHLLARGDFAVLRLTDEDRGRTELYRARAASARAAEDATDLAGYLAGLGTRVSLEPLSDVNRDRIAQLFGKTNQFNLTGVRYGETEVAALTRAGAVRFVGARVSDRFGDNGLVAALAIGADPSCWTIENFVLSCRVFGRDVEGAVLAVLLRAAADAGAHEVRAPFRQTAKNAKFADFYPRHGFAVADRPAGAQDAAVYRRTPVERLAVPDWITIDGEGAFHVR